MVNEGSRGWNHSMASQRYLSSDGISTSLSSGFLSSSTSAIAFIIASSSIICDECMGTGLVLPKRDSRVMAFHFVLVQHWVSSCHLIPLVQLLYLFHISYLLHFAILPCDKNPRGDWNSSSKCRGHNTRDRKDVGVEVKFWEYAYNWNSVFCISRKRSLSVQVGEHWGSGIAFGKY